MLPTGTPLKSPDKISVDASLVRVRTPEAASINSVTGELDVPPDNELKDLTAIQRAWLQSQVMSGKQLFWDDNLFRLTTENQLGQASEIVCRLPE
jgi:hypothetical protein